jgi:mannose-6-phosphate isomerase-like protein (cupin superfamily)
MQDYARVLRQFVTDATPGLLAFGEDRSMVAPAPGKWTPRQIVGHLLDSATNNHRRFVLGQLDRTLTFEGYAQDRWVSVQDYAHAPWVELVTAWSGINLVLAHVMGAAPEAVRLAPHQEHNLHQIGWTPIERGTPATLDDLMRDYVGHLHHHLRQILGAEWTTATPAVDKVDLQEKFARVTTHWTPHIVASLNGQHVKVVKFQGAFVWHQHELEDELFLVHRGRFRMELRDRTLDLQPGDFVVVPHGVEHRPVADEEVEVLLFEPAGTLNTGNVRNERTVTDPARL